MADRELRPIVRAEDLEERLRRASEELRKSGREAGEEARRRTRGRQVFRMVESPSFGEEFYEEARRALEDELAIAQEVEGDAEAGEDPIRPSERDREVIKRALVRLKLPQLRRLAVDIDVDSRGNQIDLVERIAREYEDDPAAVARLVLKYEEATPERGLVDRVYAIRHGIADLAESAAGFRNLAGRYIRVGIARWFVFTEARIDNNGLWLSGVYRSYSAEAKREGEDFELVSVPTDARVTARVRPEQKFVEVRARGESESRAIIRALEWGTSLKQAAAFPLNVSAADQLMAWDSRSVFMLDFLDRRLPDSGVDIINLTSAKFETATAARGFSRAPSVRSVALQGQHLLSSRAACELLVEGRGLVELSLDVRFRPDRNAEFVFPIRLTLSTDHVSLLTGYGSYAPETAAILHRELLTRLRRSVAAGVKTDDRLNALARRIQQRAESDDPVHEADIFAPPEGWGEGEEDL